MTDVWYDSPMSLLDGKYIGELLPSSEWDGKRNMNALVRLCIVMILTIILLKWGSKDLLIKLLGILLIIIIVFIMFGKKSEKFMDYGKRNESFSALRTDSYIDSPIDRSGSFRITSYDPKKDIKNNLPKFDMKSARNMGYDKGISRKGQYSKEYTSQDYNPIHVDSRNMNASPYTNGVKSDDKCKGKGKWDSFQTQYYQDPQVHWSGTMEPYPYDARMYRELGGKGMKTCDYDEPTDPDSILGVFEKVTGNIGMKKTKTTLTPVNKSEFVASGGLNQTIDFNQNPLLIHDRENAFFRDQYTRNRLRVAMGESNKTLDGHIYGAPQETRARKNLPRMTYLDQMGIYE